MCVCVCMCVCVDVCVCMCVCVCVRVCVCVCVVPAVVVVASPTEHLCVVLDHIAEQLRGLHEQARLALPFLLMRLTHGQRRYNTKKQRGE